MAEGDVEGRHPSSAITREVIESLLITYPTAFFRNDVQRRTIERFQNEMPRQRAVIENRLARFSYPELPGMVYCRLVDSVDAFADLSLASSDKMTQVGGVTYYCRYVVLPLSYVGEENVRELRRSAALNSSVDVDETIRRWQRESFANLINTFRHELVHVHTNSALDVPAYSDRTAYPTWFHEGTATYLAADPRSGLSEGYQKFQELFFYLVQRHGVRKLQTFYADVFGGSDVKSALVDVYAISGTEQLFARSSRWHRVKDVVKTGLWIAALAIIMAASGEPTARSSAASRCWLPSPSASPSPPASLNASTASEAPESCWPQSSVSHLSPSSSGSGESGGFSATQIASPRHPERAEAFPAQQFPASLGAMSQTLRKTLPSVRSR